MIFCKPPPTFPTLPVTAQVIGTLCRSCVKWKASFCDTRTCDHTATSLGGWVSLAAHLKGCSAQLCGHRGVWRWSPAMTGLRLLISHNGGGKPNGKERRSQSLRGQGSTCSHTSQILAEHSKALEQRHIKILRNTMQCSFISDSKNPHYPWWNSHLFTYICCSFILSATALFRSCCINEKPMCACPTIENIQDI